MLREEFKYMVDFPIEQSTHKITNYFLTLTLGKGKMLSNKLIMTDRVTVTVSLPKQNMYYCPCYKIYKYILLAQYSLQRI